MFDFTNDEATGSFDPIPAGKYSVVVDDAEVKTTRTGGEYIALRFKVKGGQYDNRGFYENFNIKNASEKAQQVGRGRLKSVLIAAGIPEEKMKFSDVTNLCGLELGVSVAVKKEKGYEDKNVAKGFFKVDKELPKVAEEKPEGYDSNPPW
jgi:hypothetical protein